MASCLRTRDAAGDHDRQRALLAGAQGEVTRLLDLYRTSPPDLWFTYHLYYKAPDLIGPAVCRALDIPYVVVEGSHAAKRLHGPWADFAARAKDAMARADAVIALNRSDMAGLAGVVSAERLHHLPPFIGHRARPAVRHGSTKPVRLLAIGMMRGGDKMQSYRALARVLRGLRGSNWTLTIVGAGPEATQVHAAFQPVRDRVTWAGALPPSHLARTIARHDLMVWPAVNEAFGMALVEAACLGLPVIAGRTGGVPDVVHDGETGMLVPPHDDQAMRRAIAGLVRQPRLRQRLGAAAWRRAGRVHGFKGAARQLDRIVRNVEARSCGS